MTEGPKLSEVFTPGGLPSVTYVEREHLQLEKKISNALAKGFAFNVVTGPTKSGKSVLCRKVLGGDKLVVIEGGQIKSEDQFWDHISHYLNLATTVTKGGQKTDTTTGSGSVGGGIPLFVQGNATISNAQSTQTNVGQTFQNVPIIATLKALRELEVALLVDDFHYIDPIIQKSLIQSLKGAVFLGLTVFLLAVPHRAFDPITVENEVEGRFKHIEIPPWTVDDLLLIPRRGFPALNLTVSDKTQRRICDESFGNPLLVQEACSELCLQNDVKIKCLNKINIDENLLIAAFTDIAESKGFPKFQKLKKGPASKGGPRQARPLRDGTEEDIYSVILAAVARIGPKAATSYDEIRASMKELFAEGTPIPKKNEVTSALSHMTKIAKEQIQGEPPLEWVRQSDQLIITDPFLLFYMKWAIKNHGQL